MRLISWRVGVRILLVVLAAAFVVIGIVWWLPLAQASGSRNTRGEFAPFLFAAIALFLIGATFAPPAKKSRSDEIMERARALRRPRRSRRGALVASVVLVLAALIIAVVIELLIGR